MACTFCKREADSYPGQCCLTGEPICERCQAIIETMGKWWYERAQQRWIDAFMPPQKPEDIVIRTSFKKDLPPVDPVKIIP